jgi:hypothetical protein
MTLLTAMRTHVADCALTFSSLRALQFMIYDHAYNAMFAKEAGVLDVLSRVFAQHVASEPVTKEACGVVRILTDVCGKDLLQAEMTEKLVPRFKAAQGSLPNHTEAYKLAAELQELYEPSVLGMVISGLSVVATGAIVVAGALASGNSAPIAGASLPSAPPSRLPALSAPQPTRNTTGNYLITNNGSPNFKR